MLVREVNPTDYLGLMELLGFFGEINLSLLRFKEILNERERRGIYTYVAYENGVVGTASLLVEPKFIHNGGLAGHVEEVVVRQDCRGQGVGQLLLRHCQKQAELLGCYKLVLDCDPTLEPFYGKVGFVSNGSCMRAELPHRGCPRGACGAEGCADQGYCH